MCLIICVLDFERMFMAVCVYMLFVVAQPFFIATSKNTTQKPTTQKHTTNTDTANKYVEERKRVNIQTEMHKRI